MKRNIPLELLDLIVHWFSNSYLCVKWNSSLLRVFKVCFGVRQGSVLSAYHRAVYIDAIAKLFNPQVNVVVILHLLSPLITSLQKLLRHCE